MSAAQSLHISLVPVACVMTAHPWLSIESHPIPLDILIYKPLFKLMHSRYFQT
ncbi:hypothetical protein Hdeb2414_s0004g00140771 [Helianthus debilis subsp. tardiflorus]